MTPSPAPSPKTRPRSTLMRLPRNHRTNYWRAAREVHKAARDAPAFPLLRRPRDLLRHAWINWVITYVFARFRPRVPFHTYPPGVSGISPLSAGPSDGATPQRPIRVSLAADWGTGTSDALAVGDAITSLQPHFTIHLGDIYYVGSKSEVAENMLGKGRTAWPKGSHGTFALNANHEMYARGAGYFQHLLPHIGPGPPGAPEGQGASHFALRNDHWLIIALDTGYNSVGLPVIEKVFKPSARQPEAVLSWLREVVGLKNENRRGIILLSHHQYYSQFDDGHPTTGQQLSDMIDRKVLWFWGHEHRLAFYGSARIDHGIPAIGRCVGHGGMPIEDVQDTPRDPATNGMLPLVAFDRRIRKTLPRQERRLRAGRWQRETTECPIGFNGFVNLTFEGPSVAIEYWDLEDSNSKRLLLKEGFEVRNGHLIGTGVDTTAEGDRLLCDGRTWDEAQQ